MKALKKLLAVLLGTAVMCGCSANSFIHNVLCFFYHVQISWNGNPSFFLFHFVTSAAIIFWIHFQKFYVCNYVYVS